MIRQNEACSTESVKGQDAHVEQMARYGKRVIRLNGFDDKVMNADDASKFLASLQRAVDWAKGKKSAGE